MGHEYDTINYIFEQYSPRIIPVFAILKAYMTKQKKKRNKQYTGVDATRGPVVHRYTAEAKSPLREWWDGKKRIIKWTAGIGGGAIVVVWLLIEFFVMLGR